MMHYDRNANFQDYIYFYCTVPRHLDHYVLICDFCIIFYGYFHIFIVLSQLVVIIFYFLYLQKFSNIAIKLGEI